MARGRLPTLASLLLFAVLVAGADARPEARPAEAPKPISPAEIGSVVRKLRDPVAREALIRELEVLARAQAARAEKGEVRGAVAQALEALSRRIVVLSRGLVQVRDAAAELPRTLSWVLAQIRDPTVRRLWLEVLANIVLSVAAGYAAFLIATLALGRLRRAMLSGGGPLPYSVALLRLFAVLLADLLAVGAFFAAGYVTHGFRYPREGARLVVLAWIYAFLVVRTVSAAARFVFSPQAGHLRLFCLSDETAHYGEIWTRRLAVPAVYGYFGLEAALLLGLPQASYIVLLRALGLVLVTLSLVLILQNRTAVADAIRQRSGRLPEESRRGFYHRLAQTWHFLAAGYVLLLYSVWALEVEGGFLYLFRGTVLTLLLALVGTILLRVWAGALRRGFRVHPELRARFPGLEQRANRYFSALFTLLRWVLYLLLFVTLLQAWGVDGFAWLTSEPSLVILRSLVSIFAITAGAVAIWEVVNTAVENYLRRSEGDAAQSARMKTLLTVAHKALLIALTVIAGMMIVAQLGVDIGPLLAGAGVLGLAIGFGSQKLVQDVITGIFILLEDQLKVGDVVTVGDRSGVVEAVSIRTVRLRDLAGTVHVIPYSAITSVSNLTKGFSYAVFDVGVSYRQDVDRVIEVLREIGAELQRDPEHGAAILETLEILGIDQFAEWAVRVKARFKTVASKQWGVAREFNRRMKRRFDELGIEIPVPQTTLYFGPGKGG
ncbi:MAG: mechanosensitive ion channel, partial [Deltaproteobacteria bacterium]|nr:mechanosensitive ion channel [Deltaproteobacteria bacterium]